MHPHPGPDEPCEEFALQCDDVFLTTIGKTEKRSVEILANSGSLWMRFDLKDHARVVRQFWRHTGVRNPNRLQGAVQSETGMGPFSLEGIVVGYDKNEDSKTHVLRNVILKGRAKK